MNNRSTVNIGGALEAEVLRILRDIPGIAVTPEPKGEGNRPDTVVHFNGRHAAAQIEVKRLVNPATAWQLIRYAEAVAPRPLIVVAVQSTREARNILEEHGIGIVDGLGYAHIELPGLLFHTEGRTRSSDRPKQTGPVRLRDKAGIAAQALLLEPSRDWRVVDLAENADVSTGLAHRVLARLDDEGVTTAEGDGPKRVRHLTDPTALLDLWAEEHFDRATYVGAYLLARNPQELMAKVGTGLAKAGINYAITGAAAANILAPFVTAVPVLDIWHEESVAAEQLCEATEAEPVAEGSNIVFRNAKGDGPLAFRDHRDELWLANRFRVFVDLRADPRRGREQADHLRKEVIGF